MLLNIIIGIITGFLVGMSIILIQDDLLKTRKKILKNFGLIGKIIIRIPIINVLFVLIIGCVWKYKSRKLRKHPKVSSCFFYFEYSSVSYGNKRLTK